MKLCSCACTLFNSSAGTIGVVATLEWTLEVGSG
jgi:hypothetical protein